MRKLLSLFMIMPVVIIGTTNVVSCFNKKIDNAKVPDVIAKINKANNLNYTDDKLAQSGSDYSLPLSNAKTKLSLLNAIGLSLTEQKIVFSITNTTDDNNAMKDAKSEKLDFLVKPNKNYPDNGVLAQHTQINVIWNKTSKSKDELIADIKQKITNNPKLNTRGVNLLPDVSSSITKSYIFLKLNITKEEEPLISLSGTLSPAEQTTVTYTIDGDTSNQLTQQVSWFKTVPGLSKDSDYSLEINSKTNDYIFTSFDDGIYRSNDDGRTFTKILDSTSFTTSEYSSQEIWYLSSCNGNLYMSAKNAGVWYLPNTDLADNITEATKALKDVEYLNSKEIRVGGVFEDTNKTIYYLSYYEGLYYELSGSSEITDINLDGETYINSMVENNNELFVSTNKSIYKSNTLKKQVSFYPLQKNISADDEGVYLVKNSYGKIFASTSNGLMIYDNEKNKFESYENNIPSTSRPTYMAYFGNVFYVDTNEPKPGQKAITAIYSSYNGGASFIENDSFNKSVEHSFCPLDNNNLMLLSFESTAGLYYYYEYIS